MIKTEPNLVDNELDSFRQTLRDWIEEHCPADMRTPAVEPEDFYWGGTNPKFSSPAQQVWFEAAVAKGYTAPDWPVEYGGAGLDGNQMEIFREELKHSGARAPLSSFGIWMLGPALLRYGSPEQRATHLPQIARGERRWCQGYSEPGSGSDLASLSTRAEDQDDHWLVNGQKIWTSHADKADWIFCLVRTDPAAPKHLGISFLLIDMRTPGITARPIPLISGETHFCETFFDNVVVPKGNVVGTTNRGWDVAKHLLEHERILVSSYGMQTNQPVGDEFPDVGKTDPLLRARMALLDVREAAFMALVKLSAAQAAAGIDSGGAPSVMKYLGPEIRKQRFGLQLAAQGVEALDWDETLVRTWLRSFGNSIEGGSSEVQLNIIAKRVLGLPSV